MSVDSVEQMEASSSNSSLGGSPCSSSSISSVPLLPPCRVCAEKASGLHYGVNTCEACKGFFRRSLQRQNSYKCEKDGCCVIAPGRRNSCARCRLDKCYAVGMSKEAIKTGRYTHEKRTKDTQEVKRLQQNEIVIKTGDLTDSSVKFKKTYSSMSDYGNDLQLFIEVVSKRISELGESTWLVPDSLQPRVDKFMEDYMLQVQLFGRLQPLTREEYLQFYKTTGIDVDHRRKLVEDWTRMVELGVRKMIRFAKQLPGFSDLSLPDQIGLIKGARFEVGLVATHKRFDIENECFVSPQGVVRHKTDLFRLWSEPDYMTGLFKAASRLQDMNLSVAEMVLMMAVVLFSRDRCQLDNPDKVESCQKIFVDALQYSFKVNHPTEKNLFGKMFSCLLQMRQLSECNVKLIENIKVDWEGEIQFPPLLSEMIV